MALSDYGTSFSPTQKAGEGRAKPGGGGNQTQEAIRTISTRIPRIAGGRGIAPQPLLNAPGGAAMAAPMGTMGQPNVGGLEELIRRLFGLLGGGMPAGAPPMGAPAPMGGGLGVAALSQPAPRVVPGLQQPLPPQAPVPVPMGATDINPGQNMGNFNPGQQGPFPGGPYRGPFGGG